MKKNLILYTALALLLGVVAAYAATGGSLSDPLISLSYLRGTYTDTVLKKAEKVIESADTTGSDPSGGGYREERFKRGDVLSVGTGGSLIVLAGEVQADFSGAVIDTTTGAALSAGDALICNHRYLVGEDTTAKFRTVGKTSCMEYMGHTGTELSKDTPDYTAMAEALKSLSLLRGSFTAYGSGFDLEVAPTRAAALIMFIRMLGEESAAEAYTGDCPFLDLKKTDIVYPYAAYAYQKGYTTGYTKTEFRPAQLSNEYQYTAFILRALGYGAATDISHILADAVGAGVLTKREKTELEGGGFLRADLVYMSYYALDAKTADGKGTLADRLTAQNVFTPTAYRAAKAQVKSDRL